MNPVTSLLLAALLAVVCFGGSQAHHEPQPHELTPEEKYPLSLHIKCIHGFTQKENTGVVAPTADVAMLRFNCCVKLPNPFKCSELNIYKGDTLMNPADPITAYDLKHGDTVTLRA